MTKVSDIEKIIHKDATKNQIVAIDHIGTHARLLAGPGTGKTKILTNRVLSLVLKHDVDPKSILLLTFTRLAAKQLKDKIRKVLEPHNEDLPEVSTLHSFALKQILYNSHTIKTLPNPVRIADDWEERNIIQEDLKRVLKLSKISEIQALINQLSTDWETLRIDEAGWEQQFPNPPFLGAWRNHKVQFGETLRAELVYQLKKQLEQNRDFKLDRHYEHVLIDEYQDLNACDLAVTTDLANKHAELFVAGDDDQSIYGFRYASPLGIRNFPQMFQGSKKLDLEICFRCDKNILKSAEFVASLDPSRLPKLTRPREKAEDGEVLILNFRDQTKEAEMIVKKIKQLISKSIQPDEITILLRSDRNGAMSKPLISEMEKNQINVSLTTDSEIENDIDYRIALSYMRLIVDKEDSLAWRTLMQIGKNGLGEKCISQTWLFAQKSSLRFSKALELISKKPSLLGRFGKKTSKFYLDTSKELEEFDKTNTPVKIINLIIDKLVSDIEVKESIKNYLLDILATQEKMTLEELLRVISTSSEFIEQETEKNAVNILTMHQAKGLTFDICFIIGAEDEVIPGRNAGEREGDERRLLYVSMTRARHKLFITYCNFRTGQQRYLGNNSGSSRRNLTRFLVDSKIPIKKI